ncbi:hypothetical protein QAD02_008813 [Eretmocerus hayati]|uniref:Uncharacterized protein n=1 Tax=Eretmocerus hayati TaxID=131215 RepID=A0ACC2N8Y2_9HYME|nr:hypothetical protein QAD02_008813 [Eretmocerus hayati]
MDPEDEITKFEIAMKKVYKETIKSGTIENIKSFKFKIENSYIDLCNPSNYKDVPLTDSPFGKGRETVIDKSVRESSEYVFDHEKVDFQIAALGQSIVDHELGSKYFCKPYKFIVYEKNSFFEEHVDAGEEGLEYTLSLILPTKFKGGDFKFGKDITIRGHKDFIKYVLFRIECPHNVEKVTAGFRIVLTFKVYASRYILINSPNESFRNYDWITVPQLKKKNVLISCPNLKYITDSLDHSGINYKVVCADTEDVDEVYSGFSSDFIAEDYDQDKKDFQELIEERDKQTYKVSTSIILGTSRTSIGISGFSQDRWTGNEPCSTHYEIEYSKFLLINPDPDYDPEIPSSEDSEDSSPEPTKKSRKMN